MKIRVLGSAAGGGFPQWNCNCRNCTGVRNGTLRARPRTQSSIAVAQDDETAWVLVNASPDITAQLQSHRSFQPERETRDTAIAAIVLVDGQIDHTTGLYMLRESLRPWPLWCTDSAYADLTRGNPVLQVLAHYCGVDRHRIDIDGEDFRIDSGNNDVYLTAQPGGIAPGDLNLGNMRALTGQQSYAMPDDGSRYGEADAGQIRE